jgi:peptidoglycan hydrolase-like protein with peptidoglycan-binding domain
MSKTSKVKHTNALAPKFVLPVLVGLIVGGVGVHLLDNSSALSPSALRAQEQSVAAKYRCPVPPPTLYEGDTGGCVKTAQFFLDSWGYNLKIDGDFGPKTETAVKKFQKKAHLTVDGIIGPNTWIALSSSGG